MIKDMFNLRNLRLRWRIALGFGMIVALFASVIVVVLLKISEQHHHFEHVTTVTMVRAEHSEAMKRNMQAMFISLQAIAISGSIDVMQREQEEILRLDEYFRKKAKTVEGMIYKGDLKGHEMFAEIMKAYNAAVPVIKGASDLLLAGRLIEGTIMIEEEVWPEIYKVKTTFEKFLNHQADRLDRRAKLAAEAYEAARNISGLLGGFAILLTVVIGLFLSRSIRRPLSEGTKVMKTLAGGDFTASFDTSGKDGISELFTDSNTMIGNTRELIRGITATADSVASSSEELSATTAEITGKIGEQVERANQVATSSEEMSQTIIDIAKNASNIASSGVEATRIADEGGLQVNRAVSKAQEIAETISESLKLMSSLEGRSKQIGEVIGVIKDG
ncbi:methyl-accepting chemotaxis protein, partial [Thermodesulfovibrionales bacterium]|nr:methyl-accepting chemotaxis protein [Thermodesulfovibrionales bacterium]